MSYGPHSATTWSLCAGNGPHEAMIILLMVLGPGRRQYNSCRAAQSAIFMGTATAIQFSLLNEPHLAH